MSTVGMLLLIDEIVVHATAGMPVNYPTLVRGMVRFGEFSLRGDLMVCFLVAVLAMAVLCTCCYRTRLGLATRAVSQQPVAAQLCGMSLGQVNAMTFTITGALGGIAGALIGSAVGMLSPLIVAPLTVKGLIVTVIGGLGQHSRRHHRRPAGRRRRERLPVRARRHRARHLRDAAAVRVPGVPPRRHPGARPGA